MKKNVFLFCLCCFSLYSDPILEDPSKLIHAIANTNHHIEPGIKAVQLFKLDPLFFEALKKEVQHLVKINKPSDVKEKDHVTHWTKPWGFATQYSLLNRSGCFGDTSVDHNLSVYDKKFHYKEKYPMLDQFISQFPHATNFRINIMGPQSGLSQHEECPCMNSSKGGRVFRVRFHLPIQTNSDVLMFVDGDIFHFDEGIIYFFHNGAIHSAENNHPNKKRIHLVWDMLLTTDTFQRMFARKEVNKLLFTPIKNVWFPPLFQREIDPNYAKLHNKGYGVRSERKIKLLVPQNKASR